VGLKSQNIFLLVLFGVIRLQETYKNILRAVRSSGSPQYGYSLTQLARFEFRVSIFFFVLSYFGLKDFRRHSKKKLRAGRSAESLQYGYFLAQLALCGFKVSKHFLFDLIWGYKTSRDLQKYFESCEIIRKSSIWIFSGKTGSFWVQSLQKFFVLSYLGL
jgi:hypothetical protein